MIENTLSREIIGVAIKLHKNLGPGLLESVYTNCLHYELTQAGLFVEKEKPMPLVYETIKMDCGYRMDLLVENKVVLELKALDKLNDVHLAQVLTYLKVGKFKLGLLINFNVKTLKEGLRRVIL